LLAIRAGQGVAVVDVVRGEELAFLPYGDILPIDTDRSGDLLTHSGEGVMRWTLIVDASGRRRSYGPAEPLAPMMMGVGLDAGHSADAHVLAFPKLDDGARELLLPEGKEVALAPQEDVRHCAVSPDGAWIATGSHNALKGPGAKVWDARTGQFVHSLTVGDYCGVSFSPGGKWLVTTAGGARIWSVGTWQPGPALGETATSAAFTVDDRQLAVGDVPGVVRLVEPQSGREIARLTAPETASLSPLCFTRDGTRLVCVGPATQSLYIFDLALIRRQLVALGLDWSGPALAEENRRNAETLEVTFEARRTPDASPEKQLELCKALLQSLIAPRDADIHLRLGLLLSAADQPEAADDHLRAALALCPDLPAARSPSVRAALRACGDWHVRQEHWDRAAADFVLLADLVPKQSEVGLQAAALLLTAGDRAGYRAQCRRMLRRFHDTTNLNDAERTAKACLIADELKDELPEVDRMAQFAVRKGAKSGDHMWFELAAGMAEYRKNEFPAAARRLAKNRESTMGIAILDELTCLFEAMALIKTGDTAEARRLIEGATPDVNNRFGHNTDDLNFNWHDWLLARIALQEAQRTLDDASSSAK
jgi:hypothetical protein